MVIPQKMTLYSFLDHLQTQQTRWYVFTREFVFSPLTPCSGGTDGERAIIYFFSCTWQHDLLSAKAKTLQNSAYSAIMGAVTNWEAPIYLELLSTYASTIDNLNIGAALMLLLLGVGNIFTNPLSNSKNSLAAAANYTDMMTELGRRFIYLLSLTTVFVSQIWMGVSKTIGDYYGAHVLLGLGAAPFEALVAISVADVWFVHERGSKLGVYVFGLAFGSFIGPLCSGYMAVNQGWRWIYWWGAILCGALLVLFFLTFEESRFIRSADEVEGRSEATDLENTDSIVWETGPDAKDNGKNAANKDRELDRTISRGPKAGDVFDAVGFAMQLRIYKNFPERWSEILNQMWRPLRVVSLPAVLWVSWHHSP